MNDAADMPAGRIRGVLFDLDGTLLDSAPDLTAALNRVRADYGFEPMPVATVRWGVSRGAVGMLALGFPEIPESEHGLIKGKFLEYYADGSTELSQPFPGITALLQNLDEAGIGWAIVTNKVERLTLPIITTLGWAQRAAHVVCGDTLDKAKPAPEPVWQACRALALPPADTLMIGDDPRDVQAGQAAGCVTASVAWGYGNPEDEMMRAADHHCRQVSDIAGILSLGGAGRAAD